MVQVYNALDVLKIKTAQKLYQSGLSANILSFMGLALMAVAAFLILYKGSWGLAGLALLGSGVLDLLDGAVARVAGKASAYGGILDSTLDRYGDGFIFLAIIFNCVNQGTWVAAGLAAAVLVGSFNVSYVRARAECEIKSCRVGFWERGERISYLALGFFLGNLQWVLWVLAVGSNWTAIQRLLFSKKMGTDVGREAHSRSSGSYLIKVAVLLVLVILLRIPLA